jgi:arylsulfatase A-like enzyme
VFSIRLDDVDSGSAGILVSGWRDGVGTIERERGDAIIATAETNDRFGSEQRVISSHERHGLQALAVLPLLLGVACGAPSSPDPGSPASRPSIILISIDTLRADHLGAYGYARATSPHLDRLAADGVRFADVITQSTRTLASHKSIFAATLPSVHQLSLEGRITLAAAFRDAGYDTAAFVDGGFMHSRFGHGNGFDHYVDSLAEPAPRGGRPVADRGSGGFATILPEALAWLDGRARRPFLLFLHTYDVHCPYEPEEEYAHMFTGGREAPLDISGMCGKSHFADLEITEPVAGWIKDLYDAGIRQTDHRIGYLMQELERRDLLASILVVVISDHGESLGERGWFGHNRLDTAQLFVPWIMAGPGLPAGAVIDAPAQLVDLAPTLLDYAGLAPLPETAGTSLMPVIRGETSLSPARVRVCESKTGRALLQGPWVLEQELESGRPDRLYRRDTDPEAAVNLLGPEEEQAGSILAAWESYAADLSVSAGDLPDEETPVDEEILRDLRALGYVD